MRKYSWWSMPVLRGSSCNSLGRLLLTRGHSGEQPTAVSARVSHQPGSGSAAPRLFNDCFLCVQKLVPADPARSIQAQEAGMASQKLFVTRIRSTLYSQKKDTKLFCRATVAGFGRADWKDNAVASILAILDRPGRPFVAFSVHSTCD